MNAHMNAQKIFLHKKIDYFSNGCFIDKHSIKMALPFFRGGRGRFERGLKGAFQLCVLFIRPALS